MDVSSPARAMTGGIAGAEVQDSSIERNRGECRVQGYRNKSLEQRRKRRFGDGVPSSYGILAPCCICALILLSRQLLTSLVVRGSLIKV